MPVLTSPRVASHEVNRHAAGTPDPRRPVEGAEGTPNARKERPSCSGSQVRSHTRGRLRNLLSVQHESEDIAGKFRAAWGVFASTCAQFIAPEPTYQAWFAHYLISQFGIDRVAREPMVKKAAFTESAWKAKVVGDHVRLDVVVMSRPGVHLPHYASSIDRAPDGTGLERLRKMAVISELKVMATQGGGQSHTEVARDAYKLSMLLDELDRAAPGQPLPLAYFCVLDNHPRKPYNESALQAHFDRLPHHPNVRLLIANDVKAPSPLT